jgi:chloramphenicol O-acetyltransferase type A
MKKINLSTWNRSQTFLFFKDFDYPKFSITVDLDVTNFYQEIKKADLSFYFSMMHLVIREMNKIENFRYRIIGDEVYLCDVAHPSFTDTITHTDQFKIVNTEYVESLKEFIDQAKKKSLKQGSHFINFEDEKRDDFIYVTTFPWAKFTQVTHAYHEPKNDSIPRVVWGKFEKKDNHLIMPFSIEVHHGCADGLHVGILFQNIQKALDNFKLSSL